MPKNKQSVEISVRNPERVFRIPLYKNTVNEVFVPFDRFINIVLLPILWIVFVSSIAVFQVCAPLISVSGVCTPAISVPQVCASLNPSLGVKRSYNWLNNRYGKPIMVEYRSKNSQINIIFHDLIDFATGIKSTLSKKTIKFCLATLVYQLE